MTENQQTLPELADEAAALLAQFVVPLYESDSRGRPLPHATGFFVRAGSYHFLVSAAHVLETLKKRPLFYYVSPGITRKLTGRASLNPWRGDRKNDPIDVGVLRLTDDALPPYPAVNKFAMDISYLRPTHLPREGKNYIIVGFPASRTKVNPIEREVAATAYGYRSDSVEVHEYISHGLTPQSNLLLPLDLKVGFDSGGNHRNFPRPQGMSGSPIWALYDNEAKDDSLVFPVVAIGTKYWRKERLLVGTDISVVLAMIHGAV